MTQTIVHIPQYLSAIPTPIFPASYDFVTKRLELGVGIDRQLIVDLVSSDSRPGLHPAHEAGSFYCMDLSSALMASALAACREFPGIDGMSDAPSVILDLCAAPGGKSIAVWSLFARQSAIVANEVIGKRLGALISNLKRCHVTPACVTCRDSSFFAKNYPASFPLVIVDAPCSGQSLVANRGAHSGAFHPVTVSRNVGRQRRLMAQAVQTVSDGGFLAYMTCTFAKEENEGVVDWVLRKFPHFELVEVPHLARYSSEIADYHCYRFSPENDGGSGGFVAVLRNRTETKGELVDFDTLRPSWRSDREVEGAAIGRRSKKLVCSVGEMRSGQGSRSGERNLKRRKGII